MSRSARRHFRLDTRLAGLSVYDRQVIGIDAPILYLPLYGTSSGLYDQTGNGHNGTAMNALTSTAFLNGDGATAFDGENQYIEVPDHNALSTATTGIITLEAWMRPDALSFPHYLSTGYIHWMGKANNTSGGAGQNEYVARMYNQVTTDTPPRPNRISGYAFKISGGLGAGSYFQDTISVGEWIHYVLVINTLNTSASYPTGYTKVYKNGALRDQDSLAGYNVPQTNGTNPFRIGTAEATSFFHGAVAKVAMYNYELSAQAIHNHYRLIVPPVTGTTGFIKNVGSASTTNTGTLLSIPVPSAGVSAGSTLIAKAAHAYTVSGPTVTDSRGNTYTRDQTSPNSGNTMRSSLFSAQIHTALEPGDTIQLITSASVGNKALSVDEFSQITFTSPLDIKNNGSNTSTTPGTTIIINTTNADDLIHGFVAVNGPSTDGYTEDTSAEFNTLTRIGTTSGTNDVTINSAYKSVASTGAYKYQPTLGASQSWTTILAAYKAGTPVVVPPPTGSVALVQSIGTSSSKVSGAELTITVPAGSGGVPVGNTLIIRSVGDFTANGVVVTDSRGNNYARDRSAANAGSTLRASISSGLITTALQEGDVITVTWPSTITARTAAVDEFSNIGSPITIDAQNGATGTGTAPTANVITSTADNIIIGLVGVEGPISETYTDDTAHLWTGLTRVGTTGGGATTNKTANGAYRSVGTADTYIYAPTLGTSESWVELIVAYRAGTVSITPPPTGTAAFVKNIGTVTAQVSSTVLGITVPSGGVSAGRTLIVRTMSDFMNNGPTITDSRGNTYTRDRSAADAGSTVRFSIYSAAITTPLLVGDIITLTFPAATVNTAAVADEFSAVLHPIVVDIQNGKAGSSTLPSVAVTTTHASNLLIGTVGVAGDVSDDFTNDSYNIWTGLTRTGTTGGTFAANRTINSAYRSVGATGVYTYAPTLGTSSLWIAFFVAYEAS